MKETYYFDNAAVLFRYKNFALKAILGLAAIMLMSFSFPAYAADSYFDSNGVKIRYVTEGTGEAVVLIHGWMGDSSMWGRDELGETKLNKSGVKGFQFIALDGRGHGKSGKPHDVAKYGTEMAKDILRLLDHLKIKKAHFVGYSSGAYIAGNIVANNPKRVLSVVYAGQAPVLEGWKESDFSEVDAFSRAVEENDLVSYLISLSPPNSPKPTREQVEAVAKYLYEGKDVKALAAAGSSFKKLSVSGKKLKKYKGPILFIYGANESDHVKARVTTVYKFLGRGEVKIIEGADHTTTLLKPEFGAALVNFWKNSMQKV